MHSLIWFNFSISQFPLPLFDWLDPNTGTKPILLVVYIELWCTHNFEFPIRISVDVGFFWWTFSYLLRSCIEYRVRNRKRVSCTPRLFQRRFKTCRRIDWQLILECVWLFYCDEIVTTGFFPRKIKLKCIFGFVLHLVRLVEWICIVNCNDRHHLNQKIFGFHFWFVSLLIINFRLVNNGRHRFLIKEKRSFNIFGISDHYD